MSSPFGALSNRISTVPVSIVSAGDDRLVDTEMHAAIARRLPRCEHVTIAGARHEITMETDAIRAQFWNAFDRLANGIGA